MADTDLTGDFVRVLQARPDLQADLDAFLATLAPAPHSPALVAVGARAWLEANQSRALRDDDVAQLVGLRTLVTAADLEPVADQLLTH